jgi:hypothetical protein
MAEKWGTLPPHDKAPGNAVGSEGSLENSLVKSFLGRSQLSVDSLPSAPLFQVRTALRAGVLSVDGISDGKTTGHLSVRSVARTRAPENTCPGDWTMTQPSRVQRALALAYQAAIDSLIDVRVSDQGGVEVSKVAGQLSALEEAWAAHQLAVFADAQGRSALVRARSEGASWSEIAEGVVSHSDARAISSSQVFDIVEMRMRAISADRVTASRVEVVDALGEPARTTAPHQGGVANSRRRPGSFRHEAQHGPSHRYRPRR